MAYDTVVDKAVLEQGLTQMADMIRTELDMPEPLPFPGMGTYLEKALTQKNLAIRQAKTETKAFIERTETDIYNEDVVRVSPFSHYHYDNLKTAQYPNAASAGESAFAECTALTSVSLPNAEIIGKTAFQGCTKLSSLHLPKVYEIRTNAFAGCTNLESVDLPALKTIGQYAFMESGLASISLPSAQAISTSAFRKAYNLTSVDLPNVTEIGSNAFDTCISLQEVSAPMLETIGAYGFAGCTSLKSLDLHNVTSIANHAFRKSTNLSTLYLRNSNVVTLANVGAFYGIAFINVYIPGNLIESYKTADNWSDLYNDGVVSFLPIPGTEVETTLISFTVDGTEYQAEKGMTWAQWCDSPFNPEPGFEIVGDDLVWDRYLCEVYLVGGGRVKPSDTIQATEYYGLNV